MPNATENEGLKALRAHNLKYERIPFLTPTTIPNERADLLNRLLETGEFSDFSVVCDDRTWKAHKAILCRIEYFNKVITSGLKESQENQINIPNFRPFEIDLLLRYIYHPRVDVEAACDQNPPETFLEICVRLWQLGDYYGIETLAASAQEQLRKRTERYIAEAGHVAEMLKLVPFVGELEGAIRVAWDPEKAPGPHRRLLVSLCQALGPYLRGYPVILALFDEIPEFASELPVL
ncbi:putative btb poz domain-containing protein [Diaporthe ampelina]|uniref:Putative btb poz domain-containing protein n=1 Tax=Diaporthe ampelina TaxID=1214573 RepID=A0A0G2FAD6_9PEZI|nr:putative btb poz domain-containing protein [Diaporthe ampelina]